MTAPYKINDKKPDAERKPCKIILLGDSAVGKSKLVERFLMSRYVPIQMSTFALTLFKYDIVREADGKEIDIDFWDTAGQERFATMHPAYYHEAHCCILVFDVTRKGTYKNLEKWLQELRSFREHIPCLVACNKIDSDPDVVNKGFAFAEKNRLPLHYVSAADGSNVVQLFQTAIDAAVTYRDNPQVDDLVSQVVQLLKEKPAVPPPTTTAAAGGAAGAGAAPATAKKEDTPAPGAGKP